MAMMESLVKQDIGAKSKEELTAAIQAINELDAYEAQDMNIDVHMKLRLASNIYDNALLTGEKGKRHTWRTLMSSRRSTSARWPMSGVGWIMPMCSCACSMLYSTPCVSVSALSIMMGLRFWRWSGASVFGRGGLRAQWLSILSSPLC
ncbi:unnamed protein product [Prorocentrum cordatum]|uniref:Uncharacterized protein n=1 Tax=Prorocentrum cordatum TaxID=2364126 RepID=A0ABN9XXG8_9DINO|nr:unnamed protein product [Polarella glacialis]